MANPLDELPFGMEDPGAMPPQPQVQTAPKPKGNLTKLIPFIAALVAAKQGGLPGYAQGLTNATQNRREQGEREAARQQQQQQFAAQDQRANASLDLQRQQYERQAQQDQLRVQNDQNSAITERVEQAFQNNPALEEQVNQVGPESFSLNIPGVGPLNLKQAFDRIGVMRGPDGQYHVGGKTAASARPPLVTSYEGPNGTGIRKPDVEGATVKPRPRQPQQPPTPTTRSYTWKDDDPDSETFGKSYRIIEDAQGNIIKKTPLTGGAAASSAPAAKPQDPLGIR